MRLPLLSLVLLAGACATTSPPPDAQPAAAPRADTSPADTLTSDLVAEVSIVGKVDGGAILSVDVRADAEVPISPAEPAVLLAAGGRYEAELDGGPSQSRQGDAVVSSASYQLSRDARVAAETAGQTARLLLSDGTAYRSYRVVRVDYTE